jgi:hypothetical protein
MVRDELTGWIKGMNAYNDAGRSFWIEAYGGRPYHVERQRPREPIFVPRLAVSVFGGVQPSRLSELMKDADDGLFGRFLWFWPEPVPFELGYRVPRADWAIACFERLRLLELQHGSPSKPLMMPLAQPALSLIESLGRDAQARQKEAAGLMCSALGKARGQALRLSLVLELLWWSAEDSAAAPPKEISKRAFEAAAILVGEYFMPMAERVYGDAAVGRSHRNAASLARWILREQAHRRFNGNGCRTSRRPRSSTMPRRSWLMRTGFARHRRITRSGRGRALPTLLTRLFSMRHIRPVVTLFDGVTDCDTVRHCWGRWRRPRHFPRCVERCHSLSHLNAIRCGTPNPTDHSQRRQCLLCPGSTDENNGFALWSVPRAAALEPPAQTICERRSRPRGAFLVWGEQACSRAGVRTPRPSDSFR